MKLPLPKTSLLFILIAALVSACTLSTRQSWRDAPDPDNWPTEGWRSSTPKEQGMDPARLVEMLDTIDMVKIDSLIPAQKPAEFSPWLA